MKTFAYGSTFLIIILYIILRGYDFFEDIDQYFYLLVMLNSIVVFLAFKKTIKKNSD